MKRKKTLTWYERSSRRILLDLHFPEWDKRILSKFEAKQVVDNLVKAEVDCGIFYTKDHFGNAYYNTRVGHKHRMLGERDIFKEFVLEAKQRGLWVVAYYSIGWEKWISTHKPEWVMRDNRGKFLTQGWGWVCPNSGYKEYVKAQLKEIIEQYNIDGFWLDILNFSEKRLTCYCTSCQRLFKERTGENIPLEPSWDSLWREFLEFRYESIEKFAWDIIRYIKSLNSSLSVVFNDHGSPGFDWKVGQRPVQHALFNDYGTGEAYPDVFGFLYPSLETRFIRGLVENRPYEILTYRFNRGWDYTLKPIEQLRWEVFTYLANGAKVTIVDQPFYNGRVDKVVYDRIGKVYREAKDKEKFFEGTFLRWVGLYYSVKTRDWYARGNLDKYLLSFNGAYKALVESHIPTDILFDENITFPKLKEYPLLFLANVAILDEQEIELITGYVEEGGILIATYDTGLYDEEGNPRSDFALSHLFGSCFQGKTRYKYNYFRVTNPLFSQDVNSDYFILSLGPGNLIETKGEEIGRLYLSFYERTQEKFFSHNLHPPYKDTGPCGVINEYGRGKVVYLPLRIAASYAGEYMLPEHRLLIRNIIYKVAPQPPIMIEAPLNVESVIRIEKDKNRYLVHLLVYNTPKQSLTIKADGKIVPPPMIEEAPLFKAKIKVNTKYSKVKSLKSEIKQVGGDSFEFLGENVHEIIIVEG